MISNNEKGFSLVELLLVVTIVGIIAALAVPALRRATAAAENGTTFATMRTISSTQVGFFSQNDRFGRLTEINPQVGNGIGTLVGDRIVRGRYVFEMTPLVPSDADLRSEYTITATRNSVGETVYIYELSQTGEIVQVMP